MVASADGRRAVVLSGDHVKLGILLDMCICGGILWFLLFINLFWLEAFSLIKSAINREIARETQKHGEENNCRGGCPNRSMYLVYLGQIYSNSNCELCEEWQCTSLLSLTTFPCGK